MTDSNQDDALNDHLSPDTVAWMFFVDSVVERLVSLFIGSVAQSEDENTRMNEAFNHVSSTEVALAKMGLRMGDADEVNEQEAPRIATCPGCQGQMPEGFRVCDDCCEEGL